MRAASESGASNHAVQTERDDDGSETTITSFFAFSNALNSEIDRQAGAVGADEIAQLKIAQLKEAVSAAEQQLQATVCTSEREKWLHDTLTLPLLRNSAAKNLRLVELYKKVRTDLAALTKSLETSFEDALSNTSTDESVFGLHPDDTSRNFSSELRLLKLSLNVKMLGSLTNFNKYLEASGMTEGIPEGFAADSPGLSGASEAAFSGFGQSPDGSGATTPPKLADSQRSVGFFATNNDTNVLDVGTPVNAGDGSGAAYGDPVVATLSDELPDVCNPSTVIPVFLSHTTDGVVPPAGSAAAIGSGLSGAAPMGDTSGSTSPDSVTAAAGSDAAAAASTNRFERQFTDSGMAFGHRRTLDGKVAAAMASNASRRSSGARDLFRAAGRRRVEEGSLEARARELLIAEFMARRTTYGQGGGLERALGVHDDDAGASAAAPAIPQTEGFEKIGEFVAPPAPANLDSDSDPGDAVAKNFEACDGFLFHKP